jgi:hypothetical protein
VLCRVFGGTVTLIEDNVANTGSYMWTVAASQPIANVSACFALSQHNHCSFFAFLITYF